MTAVSACTADSASAKILFLNLNDAEPEIQVARAEALRRGEEFVVIPDSDFIRRKTESLKKMNAVTPSSKLSSQEIQDAVVRLGKGATTVIISGHSDGTEYHGDTVETILRQDLVRAFKKAGMDSSIQSIYLWGCYTASHGAVRSWDTIFPNAHYLIGYTTAGAPKNDREGPRQLAGALRAEEKIRSESDSKQILADLKLVNQGDRHSLGGRVNDHYYCVQRGLITGLDEIKEGCRDFAHSMAAEKYDLYDPYFSGQLPIPEDGLKSPLRAFYQNVQDHSQCLLCGSEEEQEKVLKEMQSSFNQKDLEALSQIPCPGVLIRLIKFSHIVNNYRKVYAREFDFYRKEFKKLPPASPENAACRKILTGEYGPSDRKLFEDLARDSVCNDMNLPAELADLAASSIRRAETLLGNLRSVPFSWIADAPTDQAPESLMNSPEELSLSLAPITAVILPPSRPGGTN
ncbi:MAG: hypothetical protein H7222_13965 [Methylotenera sp.]|nr:hypothetical protein [Oligoflexia bacterium]